ncbi:hypothetical protein WCX18_04755 [Sulfurimonas sp. HSL1-2]|uniref:hypothetical protein n=1 Tax=Thiomicrolovo zhangzhouensis TaxID=3131933 RepID=UPI0031F98DC2
MINKSKNRSISINDTTLLITNAGGRCSFNHENEFCNKVLSDGRVNLGERAHIVGVNGPRANEPCNGNKNSYDNLIWLCRDHHKIIDHHENLEVFTVDVLREMKKRHESRIITGRYPYYGTPQSIHDYSVLSTIFYFINIHKLYSCVASFPTIHLDFFDVGEACVLFRQDNPGHLPLKDPILKRVFYLFEQSQQKLAQYLNLQTPVNVNEENLICIWPHSIHGENLVFRYLQTIEHLISLIEKRFPQILQQDYYDPFQ